MNRNSFKKLSMGLLIDLILHGNLLDCCGAICEATSRVRKGIIPSQKLMDAIESHMNDASVFWNPYTIGDFATAAVHLINNTPYNGGRNEIAHLIELQFEF